MDALTVLRLRLLGGCECASAAGDPIAFPTRKVRALLAYLAANQGRAQRRDKLAALLWEDRPQAQARADLRKSLSRLRQALPAAAREVVLADAEQVARSTRWSEWRWVSSRRIERRTRGAGAEQPLGDARAAIDQEALLANRDQARRAEAAGVNLRAAGAEQRDLHPAQPWRSAMVLSAEKP